MDHLGSMRNEPRRTKRQEEKRKNGGGHGAGTLINVLFSGYQRKKLSIINVPVPWYGGFRKKKLLL
jgi:hypothetical protein